MKQQRERYSWLEATRDLFLAFVVPRLLGWLWRRNLYQAFNTQITPNPNEGNRLD